MIALAAACHVLLDEWQQHVLRQGLGERPDGKWASFEVGVCVPRQNGKGEIILALQLAALLLFGDKLVIHSAHLYPTAAEAFLRIRNVLEDDRNAWLKDMFLPARTSHGEESLQLKPEHGGGRLRFMARSKGGGRGFTADRLILDEAMMNLGAAQMAAALPTLSARPNPQVWYLGSAGDDTSVQFGAVRARALSTDPGRLTWCEWSRSPDAPADDPRTWAQANPALGIRLDVEGVLDQFRSLDEQSFAVERLGDWLEGRADGPIDAVLWGQRCKPDALPGGLISFALDMAPGGTSCAIVSASSDLVVGSELDGKTHLEIAEYGSGSRWVVDRLRELRERWSPVAIVVDPRGPAGAILAELIAADFDELRLLKTSEAVAACGALQVGVQEDLVRHIGQPALDAAVRGAGSRPVGDAWLWSRKGDTDICPLVAASYAKWGLDQWIAEGVDVSTQVW